MIERARLFHDTGVQVHNILQLPANDFMSQQDALHFWVFKVSSPLVFHDLKRIKSTKVIAYVGFFMLELLMRSVVVHFLCHSPLEKQLG